MFRPLEAIISLDPGTLKREKSWVASGVERGGSLEDTYIAQRE